MTDITHSHTQPQVLPPVKQPANHSYLVQPQLLDMSSRLALQTALRVARPQAPLVARRNLSVASAPGPVSLTLIFLAFRQQLILQVRQFFAHGIPIECYPIIGVTACVLSFATFSISKHVMQDRDHVSLSHPAIMFQHGLTYQLRWLPGQGGVKYEIRSE